MGRRAVLVGKGIVGPMALALVLAALACGGGGGGDDLPVTFPDTGVEDPGPSDPGPADPGGDGGRDPGTDPAADTGTDLADTGGDDGVVDDPGIRDPGGDEGTTDPGPTDPGPTDPGTSDPGVDAPGCGTGPACAAGTVCIDGTCDTCRFHFACGTACVNCQGTATPLCLEGACVQCRVGSDCEAGSWCRPDTHGCEACGDADPAHCGATCQVCPLDLPVCEGGACRCDATSCGSLFCIEGSCQGCDADGACGPSCAPCPAETPRCLGGTCVTCREPGDCAAGEWCNAGTCATCGTDDPAHCGTGCLACGGEAPACEAGECRCAPGSCATGRRCADGVCQDCILDSACGPSCVACGAPTPFCIAGACRQCRTADDCPATWACGADGACVDPCAGTLGCANDSAPSGLKCSTAKVIGRTVAAGGINIDGDTTDDGDDDNLPSFGVTPECWDAQVDDFFRVYLRAGDKVTAIGRPLDPVYQMSLKLYRGTSCDDNWKSDLVDCQWKAGDGNPETITWTATAAGWVTIVVDGASGFDEEQDWGPYRLTVNLACADANCCCR